MLIETMKAYFAGMIDGEGCVTIQLGQNGAGKKHYKAVVVVTNRDRRPLDMFREAFGGMVVHQRRQDCYHYRIEHSSVRDCLEAVLPYLVIKRARALAVLEFISYTQQHMGQRKYAPEVEARRMELVRIVADLAAELNTKGIKRARRLRDSA